LAGENFGEFGNLLRIRHFICHLLVISEKAIGAGLNSPKFSSPNAILACYSPKFSPAKIFRHTVILLSTKFLVNQIASCQYQRSQFSLIFILNVPLVAF